MGLCACKRLNVNTAVHTDKPPNGAAFIGKNVAHAVSDPAVTNVKYLNPKRLFTSPRVAKQINEFPSLARSYCRLLFAAKAVLQPRKHVDLLIGGRQQQTRCQRMAAIIGPHRPPRPYPDYSARVYDGA